ncbi:MAG: hypothetical protein JXB30_07955, partial [Anaerolineae bacterium]|nr:hypothetical protein [Anaerolineae bacterium]
PLPERFLPLLECSLPLPEQSLPLLEWLLLLIERFLPLTWWFLPSVGQQPLPAVGLLPVDGYPAGLLLHPSTLARGGKAGWRALCCGDEVVVRL